MQTNDGNAELNNTLYSNDFSNAESIDDLIPEELRRAVGEIEEPHHVTPEADTKPNTKADESPEDISDIPKDVVQTLSNSIDDVLNETIEEKVAKEMGVKIDEKKDSNKLIEEVDRVLSGDLEEPVDDVKPEIPFWQEDDSYKQLTTKLKELGVDNDLVDSLLKKVEEQTTVGKAKLIEGLNEKISNYESIKTKYEDRISDYEEMERAIQFDNLDSTKDKYGVPINEAVESIGKILQREGVRVPIESILNAKNRTEVTQLLEEHDLSDKDLSSITNQWRNYVDLRQSFLADREAAQKKLKQFTSNAISPETRDNIFTNTFTDWIKSDPNYGYLEKAMVEGLDKNPEASTTIATSRDNFRSIIGAMLTPNEHLRSDEWMANMAKFCNRSAHDQAMAQRYYKEKDLRENLEEKLTSILKSYRELAKATSGIDNLPGVSGMQKETSGKKNSTVDVEKEYEKMLQDDDYISSLIPGFN